MVRAAALMLAVAACGRVEFDPVGEPAVIQLAAHGRHACARRADGSVWCWGENSYGALGRGTTSEGEPVARVELPGPASHIAVTEYASYAMLASGGVASWGRNEHGELGLGFQSAVEPRPTRISTGLELVEIAGGEAHICARTATGEVACAGDNTCHQLGDGTTTPRVTLEVLPGLTGIEQLGVHDVTSCARGADLQCWGGLIDSAMVCIDPQPTPAAVALPPLVQIEGGCDETMCAVDQDGGVWCWGRAALGNGDAGPRLTPAPVVGFGVGAVRAVEVAVGAFHACARDEGGAVWCWGSNTTGELGIGDRSITGSALPRRLTAFDGMVVDELDAACFSACARVQGSVYCWGSNARFQAGDGTQEDRAAPVEVVFPWVSDF